jgi:Holliday junction resolvasome RuvABC endonuclease subunit
MDEDVMRAVKIAAARTGKADNEVIEEALRRELVLDLLSGLGRRSQMSEEDADALALEAQHATRRAWP